MAAIRASIPSLLCLIVVTISHFYFHSFNHNLKSIPKALELERLYEDDSDVVEQAFTCNLVQPLTLFCLFVSIEAIFNPLALLKLTGTLGLLLPLLLLR